MLELSACSRWVSRTYSVLCRPPLEFLHLIAILWRTGIPAGNLTLDWGIFGVETHDWIRLQYLDCRAKGCPGLPESGPSLVGCVGFSAGACETTCAARRCGTPSAGPVARNRVILEIPPSAFASTCGSRCGTKHSHTVVGAAAESLQPSGCRREAPMYWRQSWPR